MTPPPVPPWQGPLRVEYDVARGYHHVVDVAGQRVELEALVAAVNQQAELMYDNLYDRWTVALKRAELAEAALAAALAPVAIPTDPCHMDGGGSDATRVVPSGGDSGQLLALETALRLARHERDEARQQAGIVDCGMLLCPFEARAKQAAAQLAALRAALTALSTDLRDRMRFREQAQDYGAASELNTVISKLDALLATVEGPETT